MLVHHPIPWSIASPGPEKRTRSPLTRISLVRRVEPVQDVHQRGLARAFSPSSVHLASGEVEVDVVVREDPRELLRDPLQLENGGSRLRHSGRFYGGGDSRKPGTCRLQCRGRQLPEINCSLISSIRSMNSCGTSGLDLADADALVLEVEDSVGAPLNSPSTTDLEARNTDWSTRLTALVRMCGPRLDWSRSTPIPHLSACARGARRDRSRRPPGR